MTGEELRKIIEKIIQGKHTKAELSQLSKILSNTDNSQLALQLGKFNVNISEGKDIHIGDRIDNTWNEEAVKSLIEVVKGNKQAIESLVEIIKQNKPAKTTQESKVMTTDFLTIKEKIQLQKVLGKSSQLQTPNQRIEFLQFCGLEKYSSSVQIADSSDKFSISIYNQLSKNYVDNGQKLALIVFLEYLIELDSSLSQQDQQFIQYVINKAEQSNINPQVSSETTSPITQIQPQSTPATTMAQERNQVFISYSHKDREWLEKLQTMLKPLMRNRTISVWDDTKIRAGAKWRDEIKNALDSAKVAVLMVSPDFLDSEFIDKHELLPLLKAAEEEGLTIIWICVSSCFYEETEIGEYQAAHDISQPLDSLNQAELNQVLKNIGKKIKEAVNDIK